MEVIQHIELGSSASTISFSSIPSTYTDLLVTYSLRVSNTSFANVVYVSFNGSTANFSGRYLEGNGSSAASASLGRYVGAYNNPTASTFGNGQLYIPNYTSSIAKSFSVDSVTEANATASYQDIIAGLWNDTSAINSITFSLTTADTFVAGSSATLYGIRSAGTGAKATGGTIYYDAANSKYVHVFTASGTFTPTQNLTGVEYLVIAGGGGGGGDAAGGGGAGGYRSSVVGESSGGGASAESTLSLTSGVGYTVTVGAGGAGATSAMRGTSGNNSVFSTITSTGGGGGGSYDALTGLTGGSGGGGPFGFITPPAAGSGTTNQGYSGATGNTVGTNEGFSGGGGGGAGQAGLNAASGATGGAGVSSSITGTAVTRAGGGGGARGTTLAVASGGSGGGGTGAKRSTSAPTSGTTNTGSGGGAGDTTSGYSGGAGGSGIVIVRYSA